MILSEQKMIDLASLYHEIRNCTSTLKGNAILLKGILKSDMDRSPVDRIERVAASIERIVRDAMRLADPCMDQPRSRSFRLEDLLRECMADYFPEAPDAFSLEIPDGLEPLLGDPDALRQAFVNLFKNSLEADASRIRVRVTRLTGSLAISVKDDGVGCQQEVLAGIFRPRQTTKRGKGGMGLGLPLVKSVIESHGGTLRAVSRPRRGNTPGGMAMHMSLPLGRTSHNHATAPDGALAEIWER